eukprot:121240_1
MIPKRPLIAELTVHGYIRKCKALYPMEIIKMIYNFYFITIFSYKIKTIGRYDYGPGIGNDEDVETLKTLRTHQKPIKNIINGYGNIYILFTDSTYECCGNNWYGQLGINTDSKQMNTFVNNNNIKINNIFSSPLSFHAFCIDYNNKMYICGKNYNNKWTDIKLINPQIQIQKIATGNGCTT